MAIKKPLLFFFLISAMAGPIGIAEAMKSRLHALEKDSHEKLVREIVTQKAPILTAADPQIEQALKRHNLPTAFQQAENAYVTQSTHIQILRTDLKKTEDDRDQALDTLFIAGQLIGGGDPLETTLKTLKNSVGGTKATLLENVNELQSNLFTQLIKRAEYFEAVAKAADGDEVQDTKVTQDDIKNAKKRFPQFVEVMRGSYYHYGIKHKMATTSKQSSDILANLKTADPLPLDKLFEIALKFMDL